MQRNIHIHRWVLATWLMLWGCVMSSAYAYDQAAQTSSWRTMPTYSVQPTYAPAMPSSVTNYSTPPAYNFKSTSTCPSVVGNSVFSSTVYTPYSNATNPIRRTEGSGWDEDEDPDENEIGVVTAQPIGEPFILLVLALLYVVFGKRGIRIFRRNH